MRVLVSLLAAALLFAAPALAGPARTPAFSWTGCYIGAGAGVAWDDQKVSTSGSIAGDQAPVAGILSDTSGLASVYGGCNWQFAPAWVVGVEGDFSWTQLEDSASAPNLFFNGAPVGSGGINWSRELDRFGSVRARFGYAVMPDLLVFGTGGIAWAHSSFAGLNAGIGGCPNCRSSSFSDTLDGFVVGGGIDWAPWRNNWLLRLEYLHYEFSDASSVIFFGANRHTFNWVDESVDSVRAGLSYKF